ncbi:MAG: phenylalanine--tRNA ligase subunit beta, partial [Acidobacteriota bacterium]
LARLLTSAGLAVETMATGPDGDTIFDIEIVSNRPDCMNVYGVARELAAATGRELCPYPGEATETPSEAPAGSLASVTIEAAALCSRYDARIIRGIRVGPSPDWLARRLVSIGLRPVNNVVDATNYILWEFGHPLHAFDLATLKGPEIRVRLARKGESIRTLDETSRRLDTETLVIADAERPVAIAGVMGGAETMVTNRTHDLLLESAHFDPISVRRTAKRLSLSTDASYRFERGADVEATAVALNRVADLIVQIAGGSICPGIIESRGTRPARRRVRLRADRVSLLLGMPVDSALITRSLKSLQFTVKPRDGSFEVEIPTHRQDIEREVDLIEEVGRRIGYNAIPERLPHIAGTGGISRLGARREKALRRALEAAGCSEAVTSSFATASSDWRLRQRLDAGDPAIEPIAIANPVAADQDILRTTLLPGLLAAVARNINRGMKAVRLYEIGRTFRRGQPGKISHRDRKHPPASPADESVSLGIVLTGNTRPGHWKERPREVSFFDMKGLLEAIAVSIRQPVTFAALPASEAIEENRSMLIRMGGRRIGRAGALKTVCTEQFGLKQEVHVAELNLSEIFLLEAVPVRFRPLPRYPSVCRDLSLIVDRTQAYGDLEATIRDTAPDRVVGVTMFDRYTGGSLPSDKIGVSITIVYQHPERTLTSKEVSEVQDRILARLGQRFGVSLRN